MFVRARLEEGVNPQALLVPQVGVTRDQKGVPVALVVNAEKKVERRQLVTDRAVGDAWLVTEGIKAGEQVIVEGLQKVRPGAPVNPVPGRRARSSRRGRPRPEPRPPASRSPVAQFFIDRPIFAWVIGILVMLGGALSIFRLPVSQYPAIAPPTISVYATYPGASARTLEDTVTQVIEQRMNGLDNLRYMASSSDSAGNAQVTLTFDAGTNPDIAQVQVQNKLQLAVPQLPQEVQRQGVRVAKSVSNYLLIIGLVSEDGSMSRNDISDYAYSSLQDQISRVSGVGEVNTFGSQYAMRIWLDPARLAKYRLTPLDVSAAVQAQNAQVSAGQLGGLPAVDGQRLTATITAQTRLQTAGAVPRHPAAGRRRRVAGPARRRGPGGAGRRDLGDRDLHQRPALLRHRGAAGGRRQRPEDRQRGPGPGRRAGQVLPARAEGDLPGRHHAVRAALHRGGPEDARSRRSCWCSW